MPTPTQQNRSVRVYTALPDDVLLFGSMSGAERLSEPFEYELVLVSEDGDIDPADLLGTDLTVELELPAGGVRHFHGYVADFGDAPGDDDGEAELSAYTLSVRPWLWFLSRTADCRIFQEMSVPDIVQEVVADAGFDDIDIELTESFAPWTYCVQYRETDLAFVSRLMEQEGIHYYFRHEHGRHRLVLADGGSGHETFADYADVPLFPPDTMDHRERDHLVRWRIGRNLRPGRFALGDFNFETPSASLEAEKLSAIEHAHADFEVYDYPGEHTDKAEGETRAKVLLEASEARHETAHGTGSARGLLAGNRFALTGSTRDRDNREYLVVASECTFSLENFRSGGDGGLAFECRVEATGSDRPWRAARRTPRPRIRGPQTAIVVGPAGEEIWTDKHGRVKLQFHWDRYGQHDENSSCWIRVSQVHAGAGFGGVDIPRIGEEVIVEFLEGDPDRPIVTGRVYNGDNGTPTSLPSAGMVSGLKSNSTPGGGGYNEMLLDDTKDKERIAVHAQRDRNTTVKHDDTLGVGHDRTVTVKNHLKTTVTEGNEEHEVAAGTSSHSVMGAVTETYEATQETTVTGDLTIRSKTGVFELHADASNVLVKAATNIKFETGASTIEMDAVGNITIKGINVAIEGAATVSVAGAIVTSEASVKHDTKGVLVMSEGSATNTVKGGVVLLNP